jgi:3-hydroxyacyl-CoA dehydrogenase/enoyl-CoA hydratase/3-hydroxybutyryl-CoA epimerase
MAQMAEDRGNKAPLAGFDGLRFRHWRLEARADGVIVVAIDREGQAVNALSQEMLVELDALLERLAIDPPRGVVFRSGKASGFVAGADVREFREFDARGTVDDALFRGQQALQKLASLPCPTVACRK